MKLLLKTAVIIFCVLLPISACGAKGGYSARAYEAMPAAAPGEAAMSQAYDGARELAGKGFSPAAAVISDISNLYGTEAETPGEAAPAQPVSPGEGNDLQHRKLVKTADLRLRVEDAEAAGKSAAELMEKFGAWPASSNVYENSRSYTIRVPSLSYDAMLAELAGIGRLLRRAEDAEDVTLHYYDLESRLATKRELLKTYQSYLGRANDIEEIMTVESKIADLQQEIDSTGTQFRNLANLIDYSTINLEIVGPVSASSYSEPTLGEKLKELFGSFGDVASQALVVLMGILIYGVPGILIAILLFYVLFGRIGLLKKLWRLAAGKKAEPGTGRKKENLPRDVSAAESLTEGNRE